MNKGWRKTLATMWDASRAQGHKRKKKKATILTHSTGFVPSMPIVIPSTQVTAPEHYVRRIDLLLDFADKLPEYARDKYINNVYAFEDTDHGYGFDEVHNRGILPLFYAFDWATSPEKGEFWTGVATELEDTLKEVEHE